MIRILIADDHAIVRGGLKQIIATTTDIVAAGEATHGAEVIDKVRQSDLDLLLLDMTMPGLSGVDLVRRVRERGRSGAPGARRQAGPADPGAEHA